MRHIAADFVLLASVSLSHKDVACLLRYFSFSNHPVVRGIGLKCSFEKLSAFTMLHAVHKARMGKPAPMRAYFFAFIQIQLPVCRKPVRRFPFKIVRQALSFSGSTVLLSKQEYVSDAQRYIPVPEAGYGNGRCISPFR